MNTPTISAQVAQIANLAEFSRRSGIPHRTLVRIKAEAPDYQPSPSTALAIQAALSRLKPKLRDDDTKASFL